MLTQEEIILALEDRFSVARTIMGDKRLLRSRTKTREESYKHLAQDLMRLSHRVYRGAPHLVKQEARDAFVKALPAGLRCPIAAANPRTLNECVANVMQMHAVLDGKDIGRMGDTRVNAVKIEDITCFQCNQKRHYAKVCSLPGNCKDDNGSAGRYPNKRGHGQRGPWDPLC